MSITEEFSYDKEGQVVKFPLFRRLFLPSFIILVSILSFGLGRLSVVGDREAVKIEYDPSLGNVDEIFGRATEPILPAVAGASISASDTKSATQAPEIQVVASKNGERYHFLHCSGAKQIKEENKIVFGNQAEAEAAGYTLALNCSPR